ncbi:MBOAT family O-acyltransferase [Flavobacterium caeni]|uniref:D-alanyl-lipoteichoic acid acyltransferase DltB, MBOAT superfamily n=1 Tax=Flavobacterium caeni TaxID=490189 RepID=A0A1G5J7F1_9FLAO|nr:MBOAT family O-acyltransferase [Flavobacterium caeni]SCY83881.1 D-alanyl-lipoteichoic acid acyltransferase DltB, MBOAT superfamily [Flavobacterium caeni]
MLFNTVNFAVFLPVVLALYWLVTQRNLKLQNVLLLAASYFFYACWDVRFLALLIFSTGLDYYTGIKIHDARGKKAKKFWLWLSLAINLGFLGIFKYYNFFVESFADGIALFGARPNVWLLDLILPVGISFYTFHGISYIVDIYRGKISPERNFVNYSVFVSFFPLLVAGPIERATHLLPQIRNKRIFSSAQFNDGLRQILWGLVKKVVIADNCGVFVDDIFSHSDTYSGSTLVLGAILFSFQLYGDFSGYSDIALGTARLFGIELLRNFSFPYFSRDIAEFWRRWHMSLTTWFKDYVYIPLGGSKSSKWFNIRNVFIIFLLSGIWHGASWKFVCWAMINALYFLPLLLANRNRKHLEIVAYDRMFPTPREVWQMVATFMLTVFSRIFFRADDVHHAFAFIKRAFSESLLTIPQVIPTRVLLLIAVFMVIEWTGRRGGYAIAHTFEKAPKPLQWSFYYVLVFAVFYCSNSGQQFIYFQF